MIKYLVCRFNRLPPSPSSNPISAGCDGLFVDWSGDWDLSPILEKYGIWGFEFLYIDSPFSPSLPGLLLCRSLPDTRPQEVGEV